VLHLRALEAARRRDEDLDVVAVESSLFDERFLLERPVLRALRSPNAVLLVDEVDRADDEFEAFLLEVLSTNAVTIPELGTVRPSARRSWCSRRTAPARCTTRSSGAASTTGSTTRPGPRGADPAGAAAGGAGPARRAGGPGRAGRCATAPPARGADLLKPPGVAESLDWARCLVALGATSWTSRLAAATLGAVCKYREDADRVRASLDRLLAG
jgi:hypothetical protein